MRYMVPMFAIVEADSPEQADQFVQQKLAWGDAFTGKCTFHADEIFPTAPLYAPQPDDGPPDGEPRSMLQFFHPDDYRKPTRYIHLKTRKLYTLKGVCLFKPPEGAWTPSTLYQGEDGRNYGRFTDEFIAKFKLVP